MKNNRTFLEKLLDGAEVEWKPLSLVTEMQRGKTITAKSANKGKIPVISGGQKPAYYHSESNRDGKTITVAGSGAYAGYIMYWEEPIFVSDAFSIKTDESLLQIKYVYHFLLQNQQKIHAMKKGSGVPHVYPKDIGTLMIPIPPLPVQTEIVKILDALTALTSELTSELTLRRKQSEYYREKLLSEEELGKLGGEWKNLKDVLINLRTGLNPRNNFKLNTDGAENYYITVRELDSVNIKITDKTDKISNQARKIIDKRSKLNIGDILFSGTGTIGKTAFISELPRNWNIKEGVYALTVNQEIIKPMYLLRLLQSEITKKQINNFVMGSTVKSISMADLKKVKILIPSLDEQQRIVSILDKFETLTNSITEGLPLAIEQSQKRYEYYRELLLNFPGRE